MRYAIIQKGGKQYKAVEGQTIEVDLLEMEVGKKVDLTEVLLVSDGDKVLVGTPTLSDASVAATVVAQDQGPKVTVFKYKPKIRYRVKTGHRQKYTRLQIDSIEVKGLTRSEAAKQAAPAAEPKAEKPEARRKPTAAKPTAAKAAASAKKQAAKKPAAPPKKKPAAKKPATRKAKPKKK
ncbi:MAG TPA: 50S ribosomal protein L21 [Anaerolineales bacterium]